MTPQSSNSDSVVDAVAVRRRRSERSSPKTKPMCPLERRIVFRIGINLGDVVVEGEDLLGDGVNIAARLNSSVLRSRADLRYGL